MKKVEIAESMYENDEIMAQLGRELVDQYGGSRYSFEVAGYGVIIVWIA